VRFGHCEVHHNLDLRIGQQVLNAARPWYAELLRPCFGAAHVDVRAGSHIQDTEEAAPAEVRRADVAASHNANLDLLKAHLQ